MSPQRVIIWSQLSLGIQGGEIQRDNIDSNSPKYTQANGVQEK